MKCVMIGDIGRENLYHLGDEAMTEVAIEQLHHRGIDGITLVAGQPEVAEKFYGLPAVGRPQFSPRWGGGRMDAALEKFTNELPSNTSALAKSVSEADAVVIAGGGNMNSQYVSHLYQRTVLTRLAKYYDKPLFVSSQTIGPMLRPRAEELLKEIVTYAESFGARETVSYELAVDLGGDKPGILQTMDDAILLATTDEDRTTVDGWGLSDRYFVASFTSDTGTSGMSRVSYVAEVAKTLDALATEFDVDIALTPHTGSLEGSEARGDYALNQELVAASSSGRLRALPLPTARQGVALTEKALLSLSTRYHPTVFGPVAGVPTVSISLSYYSSVRMRGSMSNVGLKDFVVPSTSWSRVHEACSEMVERADDYREHMKGVSDLRSAGQSDWWDAIADGIRGGSWSLEQPFQTVDSFSAQGDWSTEVEYVTPVFDKFGQEKTRSSWINRDLEETKSKLATARKKTKETQRLLHEAQSENSGSSVTAALTKKWRSRKRA